MLLVVLVRSFLLGYTLRLVSSCCGVALGRVVISVLLFASVLTILGVGFTALLWFWL